MRIYLASSWRNPWQPSVLKALREAGHEVYDFRNPPHGHLNEPARLRLCDGVFVLNDMDAMEWADVCVLLLPCGKSAHSEAGWMQGAGKPTYVLLTDRQEPELMYKLFAGVFCRVEDLLEKLQT